MANNIFLIGFSGSGKSSVGKKLAKSLNYNFLDTDRIIEKTTSLSIDETISTKGEKEFRNIETQVLSKIDFSQNNVISTGGGLPTEKDNIRIMKIKKTTKTEAVLVNLRSSNLSTIGSPKYAKTPATRKGVKIGARIYTM